eukprot:6323485-Prymnesium_polylepis.1
METLISGELASWPSGGMIWPLSCGAQAWHALRLPLHLGLCSPRFGQLWSDTISKVTRSSRWRGGGQKSSTLS